eukprot:2714843-Prymnesium_polylepis.1
MRPRGRIRLAHRANTLRAGEATHGDGAPAKARMGVSPPRKTNKGIRGIPGGATSAGERPSIPPGTRASGPS